MEQKFVCLGHQGTSYSVLKKLVFSKFIWNCRCSDVYMQRHIPLQFNINNVLRMFTNADNSCLQSKFSQQSNLEA